MKNEIKPSDFRDSHDKVNKMYLVKLLTRTHGDVAEAAEQVSITRESFYRLCKKYKVKPSDFSPITK